MNTTVSRKGGPVGFTIVMSADEAAELEYNPRTGKVNLRSVRAFLAQRLMRDILRVYHGVQTNEIDRTLSHTDVRTRLSRSSDQYGCPTLTLVYRFVHPYDSETHFCSFRLERDGDTGLGGTYIVTARR